MSITIELTPEKEAALAAKARAAGVQTERYAQQILERDLELPQTPAAENLSDLLLKSPFAGAELDLSRPADYPRSVELE